MKKEPGTAVYDSELRLEAYRFRRSFPKHFHDHYVVGYVEDGQGGLVCRDVEYSLKKGDVVIYNPGDSHACAESGADLDYRGLHIPKETMLDLTGEIVQEQGLTALMVTHNMKDAIQHGNRLIMMYDGRIVIDVSGEEKKKLTVPQLLELFNKVSGSDEADDKLLLS